MDGEGSKSTLGHLKNGRHHVKCPQLSTGGGGGKLGKIWST